MRIQAVIIGHQPTLHDASDHVPAGHISLDYINSKINLRQLRNLCEVVDRGLKISDAAEALHHSRPSITRQMQELEQELGMDIFIRNRNRILDLTPLGREVLALARRVVRTIRKLNSRPDLVIFPHERPVLNCCLPLFVSHETPAAC